MNLIISLVSLVIGLYSHQAKADCGNQDLQDNLGYRKYDRFGEARTERCNWTFNMTLDESNLLLLDIKKFNVFREGTPNNAYLTMPDGQRINFHNSRGFVENCFLFARRNFQSNECLDELAEKYCSNPIIEVDQWPPTLSSTSLTSYYEKDDVYSYDIAFTFFYMYISCPKTNQIVVAEMKNDTGTTKVEIPSSAAGSYFVSTIAVSSLLIVALGATTITLIVLMKKTRKARAAKKPTPQQRATTDNSISTSEHNAEDIYENPNYVYAQEPPVTSSRHPYCQIDLSNEAPQGSTSDPYHTIQQSEVVNNVLYNM